MTKKVILIYVTIMVIVAAATFWAQHRYTSDVDRDYLEIPESDGIGKKVSSIVITESYDDYDEDSDNPEPIYHVRLNEDFLFESKVDWPDVDMSTATESVYNIDSGSDKNISWFEGKGYILAKPDDIYHDLLDPNVMGPSNVAQSVEKKYFRETKNSSTYVIHVDMNKDINFYYDINVWINYESNSKDEKWLIIYDSEKLGGGSIIKNLNEFIMIEAINQNWSRVFLKSKYNASELNVKEIHKHYEQIFERWATLNKTN